MRKIYSFLSILFLFTVITSSLKAQVVTIGTGTSVQRQPITYYYGFGRSSMIYTAAEIGNTSGAVVVVSVAFYCNTALNTGPTVVYLNSVGATTNQTATTWAAKTAPATQVYSGTPAIGAVGWRTITLTSPYELAANQNLEVMVETNFGGGGTGASTGNDIRYSTVANAHQFWQQDGSAPTGNGTVNGNRPNIQLTLAGPCVSNPGGGNTQGPATACAGSSFLLSVSGASFGVGMTYQWESSPDGTTWTSIPGATGSNYIASQTTATYYRRKITCSGTDGFSTALQVNQNTFIDCYCSTGLTSSVNGVDIITKVSLTNAAGFNYTNTTTSNGSTNYVSYNNTPVDLAQQTSNSLAVTFGTDGIQWSAAWIDYNQNGVFESSENIALAGSSAGGSATVTYNFIVPAGATLGNTRMRVRGGSDGAYTIGGACANTQYGETEDYLVNITPAPPCVAPTNLALTAIGPTTATITWSAPTPGPGDGYEWEIRTAGAGGSGATGLAASGSVGAGITTANVTGLTLNTSYSLYVRSACTAGSLFSTWAGPFAFQTPCTFITTFPFVESFETTSTTLPCWRTQQVSGPRNWTYETATQNAINGGGTLITAHGGTRNAAHYGNGTGSVARLISPAFDFSGIPPAGAELRFWYANESWVGDLNELRVYYKTSAFGAWTLIPGAVYTANVNEWTEVELALPGSTTGEYYIAFEGTELFGFGIMIDDVTVTPVPTCRRPASVTALGVTSTSVEVSFTSPGTDFIVEYGAPGFVPGTGAAAGAGTIVTGTASPIAITGLAVNTAYDFYIRRVCVAGVDYSENVLAKASTLCAPVNVPYIQNFTGVTTPNLPTCTSLQDLNGKPTWQTFTPPAAWGFPGTVLRYAYDVAKPGNDWFYTQGLNLTAGVTYELDYKYGATDANYPERMKVAYGSTATAASMTNLLKDYPSIVANPAAPFAKLERLSFTPSATGVYYIGFQVYSLADQFTLYLDSIHVKVLPVVDAAVTAVTLPPGCPGNNAIQVTVLNNNLIPLDFAANPVTVTAALTGAATTNITTTVNTGTLAPGATRVVTLPVYNFLAGNYNMTASAVSPDDPETVNNSVVRTFVVNATPTAAVITPSSATICLGQVAQLNTQFTGTGNPKVTWSPITGLYVNAAANQIYTTGVDAYTVWAKPTTTTTYTVTTTNLTTGCTNTSTVTVNVNGLSTVNISTVPPTRICVNDEPITLAASPAGGTWTGVGVSGGTTFVPSLTMPGSFTLTYTYTNATNCTTSSSIIAKVEECPERRRLLRDDAVIMFPNPSNGNFSIRINSTLYTSLIMKVYTPSGNVVHTQSLKGLAFGRVLPFNLSHLPGGSYQVQFTYDGGVKFSDKVFTLIIGR